MLYLCYSPSPALSVLPFLPCCCRSCPRLRCTRCTAGSTPCPSPRPRRTSHETSQTEVLHSHPPSSFTLTHAAHSSFSHLSPHVLLLPPSPLPVLMSQVLHHYHPRLVDLHNYTSTLSPPQKLANWQTLNAKVLRKLRCPVPAEEVDRLVKGEKGAIERLLWAVYRKVAEWEEGTAGRSGGRDGGELEHELIMTADGSIYPWPVGAAGDGRGKAEVREESGSNAASKDRVIADQRDAIEVSCSSPCSAPWMECARFTLSRTLPSPLVLTPPLLSACCRCAAAAGEGGQAGADAAVSEAPSLTTRPRRHSRVLHSLSPLRVSPCGVWSQGEECQDRRADEASGRAAAEVDSSHPQDTRRAATHRREDCAADCRAPSTTTHCMCS